LLNERGVSYTYREYTKDPLTAPELRELLRKLGLSARDVLRTRDAADAGLTGKEPDDAILEAMAANPRLLQRPIGIVGDKAVLGRPVERLLELL
jgi:arsenate reductase